MVVVKWWRIICIYNCLNQWGDVTIRTDIWLIWYRWKAWKIWVTNLYITTDLKFCERVYNWIYLNTADFNFRLLKTIERKNNNSIVLLSKYPFLEHLYYIWNFIDVQSLAFWTANLLHMFAPSSRPGASSSSYVSSALLRRNLLLGIIQQCHCSEFIFMKREIQRCRMVL